MISQYSDPRDIDREFWDDHKKARYWLRKHTNRRAVEWRLMEDGQDVMDGKADYKFSEPIFYQSPQTGNRWLLYISRRPGAKEQTAGSLPYRAMNCSRTLMLMGVVPFGSDWRYSV